MGETALALHHHDVAVLYGTSFADFDVPYQPFVECLEHLFTEAEPGAFSDVLPESAHHLRRLTPVMAETDATPKEQVPGFREDRQELFAAFRDLMHALAQDRPVALILEDLHWENEPTRQLLSYPVHSSESDRLLILATHRSTPPGPQQRAADHGEPSDRDGWLLSSADNLVRAVRFDDARLIYQDLVSSADPRVAALAAVGFEDATWRPGRDGNTAAALIDRVLDAMGEDPDNPFYIRLLASKARALVYLTRCIGAVHARRRNGPGAR